ncbi:hypothetical protein CSB45_13880 [candidate division KSB3 bacterium]|uniref:Uncharacterized protein n=1 Tax=candidate division KSB3 bacterium TaxID=2044937 RepID=A0A2G6E1F6_9BACT|nr:MAG: hypothetical protein CSB45_13880 [candidate division KSB3 bacterium]PIE28503.1 MAG: hypothetical protein CSA57_13435 [candidate division KSB3 bacterium]
MSCGGALEGLNAPCKAKLKKKFHLKISVLMAKISNFYLIVYKWFIRYDLPKRPLYRDTSFKKIKTCRNFLLTLGGAFAMLH